MEETVWNSSAKNVPRQEIMPELILRFIDESTNADTFMRGMKNDFGVEVWSVYDFINVLNKEKLNDDSAGKEFGLYTTEESEYYSTVMPLCTYSQFASKFFLFDELSLIPDAE